MNLITPIVVVAFNRERSLKRLLKSLESADYPSKKIPLIISIDFAENNQSVINAATDFDWAYGKKEVIIHKKNLGLKKHVIQCGSFSLKYGSVILLEDDLYVSPNFYNYTVASLTFSLDKEYVGGVSLYNHQLNVINTLFFTPIEDGYDNWYFQFASSWGQAWNKNQFEEFLKWFNNNEVISDKIDLPKKIRSWSQKSWLRYFIAYLVDRDKYFIYPKVSLSTNFSDVGTHIDYSSPTYQVPILSKIKKDYSFSTLGQSNSVYDSYFENIRLYNHLKLDKSELDLDLNGIKEPTGKRYILSKKIYNFKIIRSFGRFLRPIDMNIIKEIVGNDFHLYDSSIKEGNQNKENFFRDTFFHLKYISHRNSLKLFLSMTKSRVQSFFKR